jgi:hypothetical protein
MKKSLRTFIRSDFQTPCRLTALFFQFVSFPAALAYPAGTDSAQIRRRIASNTRRVL